MKLRAVRRTCRELVADGFEHRVYTLTLAACLLLLIPTAFASAQGSTPGSLSKPSRGSISTTMMGAVLDPMESPIFNAEIWFPTLKRSARSDSLGHFRIDAIPAGSHVLLVRRMGYEAMSAMVNVTSPENMDVEFLLKPAYVKLDNVVVTASFTTKRLAEFESHRKAGIGRFMTTDFFQKNSGRNMSEILSGRLGGVHTVGGGAAQIVVSTRYGSSCAVQVIVDGQVLYNGYDGQQKFDINSIRATDVLGVEYYTSAETPVQYGRTSGGEGGLSCGTLVVWTR